MQGGEGQWYSIPKVLTYTLKELNVQCLMCKRRDRAGELLLCAQRCGNGIHVGCLGLDARSKEYTCVICVDKGDNHVHVEGERYRTLLE